MACKHRTNCPIYPKLGHTLQSWKNVFCDHETQFKHCERYILGEQGKPVPITLLPNGRDMRDIGL